MGLDAVEAIFARRSVGRLFEPAPSDDELRTILRAGACAPDHDELRPFRFVVLRGEGKEEFGEVLLDALLHRCSAKGIEPTDGQKTKERTKLGRAPLVIVVGAVRQPTDKIPWQDQLGAAFAAAENMLIAATALGYGSMWRTGDVAFDPRCKAALGLGDDDAIVGYLYVGTPSPDTDDKPPRDPDLDGLVTEWSASGGAGPRALP